MAGELAILKAVLACILGFEVNLPEFECVADTIPVEKQDGKVVEAVVDIELNVEENAGEHVEAYAVEVDAEVGGIEVLGDEIEEEMVGEENCCFVLPKALVVHLPTRLEVLLGS